MRYCTVENCGREHYAKDFCRKHYAKYIVHKNQKHYDNNCAAPDCKNKCYDTYCAQHLSQLNKSPDKRKGANSWNWNNGIFPYPNHYKMKIIRKKILAERGEICEICEQYGNEIHHKDKTKTNHSEENFIIVCHKCHMGNFHSRPRPITYKKHSPYKYGKRSLRDMSNECGVSTYTLWKYFNKQHLLEDTIYIIENCFGKLVDRTI